MISLYEKVDTEMGNLIHDLQKLIRQSSVSAKNEGLEKCAQLVNEIMLTAGISSMVCSLDSGIKSAPIVYGEIKSRSNPYGKTILFYNHYDVQPVEPITAWSENPFGGIIKGNKIFGRGASDDKGE